MPDELARIHAELDVTARFTDDDVELCKSMADHFDTLREAFRRRLNSSGAARAKLRSDRWAELGGKILVHMDAYDEATGATE